MATFSFNGIQVDSSDPDFAAKTAQAIESSGGTVRGSIVAGSVYGVTGGTVTGNVNGVEDDAWDDEDDAWDV